MNSTSANPTENDNISRLAGAFLPVMHMFHQFASEVVKSTNFSLAQYRVLMLVHRRGSMSINQLKDSLNIAQSTASEMIDRLVRQNLLHREKDPADRRVTIFMLTPKTQRIINDHLTSMVNIHKKILEPLSPEEQEELVQAFETVLYLMQQSSSRQ